MLDNIGYSSICSTCTNAQNCTYLKNSDGAILFCENFEIDIPLIEDNSMKETNHIKNTINIKDINSAEFFGLCINCDNRGKCALPIPEGGVWHCEEFQ